MTAVDTDSRDAALSEAQEYETLAAVVRAKAAEFGQAHIRSLMSGASGAETWKVQRANRDMELALYGYAQACTLWAAGRRAEAAGNYLGLHIRPKPLAELLQ